MYRSVKLFCSRAKPFESCNFKDGYGVGFKFCRVHYSNTKNLHARERQYPGTKVLTLLSDTEIVSTSEKFQFSSEKERDLNVLFNGCDSLNGSRKPHPVVDSLRAEGFNSDGGNNQSFSTQTNVSHSSSYSRTLLSKIHGFAVVNKKLLSKKHNQYQESYIKNSPVPSLLGCRGDTKHRPFFLFTGSPVPYLWANARPNHPINYSTGKVSKSENLNETSGQQSANSSTTVNHKEKLKAAFKDYGIVIVVFHITVSVISLGACYLLIASGAAQGDWFKSWGIDEGAATAGMAAIFIIAYAIHKTLAPWRIGITLIAVPFIVRRLRTLGYLKTPKPKQE